MQTPVQTVDRSRTARPRGARPRWLVLLDRTLRRLRLAAAARRGFCVFLSLAAGYGAVLLFARLTGLVPWRPQPLVFASLPAVAAVAALLWPHKPSLRDAARAVDRHARSNDLFLTMMTLEGSAGEFQSLVTAKADKRATEIRPRNVAPLGINRRLAAISPALAAFIAIVFFVPQLDPFGKVDASQQAEKETRQLDQTKKATQERLAQIDREIISEKETKEVKQALDQFKATLSATQSKARQANAAMLADTQKKIADQWRKISAEKLKELLSHSSMSQQVGSSSAQSKKWLDELQAGSTESLKKEFAEMQKDLEELSKARDPVKRAQLQKKIRERLDALAEFAGEQAGSKPLAAALKRVQNQMRMAAKADEALMESTREEATRAASESMQLAQKELEQIAQSAKDLQSLEKALEVMQMAKRLNGADVLDGKKLDGLQTMAEYEAMFEKMMKGVADEEGFGDGSPRSEDDSTSSKFKTELSKSQIIKGKVLLTLKTKGLGDHVDVKEKYQAAVRDVKQGISEAILQEEIPPGYHEAIKGYFDSLDETPAAGK